MIVFDTVIYERYYYISFIIYTARHKFFTYTLTGYTYVVVCKFQFVPFGSDNNSVTAVYYSRKSAVILENPVSRIIGINAVDYICLKSIVSGAWCCIGVEFSDSNGKQYYYYEKYGNYKSCLLIQKFAPPDYLTESSLFSAFCFFLR